MLQVYFYRSAPLRQIRDAENSNSVDIMAITVVKPPLYQQTFQRGGIFFSKNKPAAPQKFLTNRIKSRELHLPRVAKTRQNYKFFAGNF